VQGRNCEGNGRVPDGGKGNKCGNVSEEFCFGLAHGFSTHVYQGQGVLKTKFYIIVLNKLSLFRIFEDEHFFIYFEIYDFLMK
jgi:hypothetical protein